MANDPAFLFYPGDYLRDTQNFTAEQQVAYDRIMCEHMRNICVSKTQVNFFTKRLSADEKKELLYYLVEVNGGYQIAWVAESIIKRRAYSESRRENKIKKHHKICSTYDEHMENENEIESEDINASINIYKEEIAQVADQLYQQGIFKTVPKFVGWAFKHSQNPEAILHTLKQCLAQKPKSPWGFCQKVLENENGKFNALDSEKRNNELKKGIIPGNLKSILQGIG